MGSKLSNTSKLTTGEASISKVYLGQVWFGGVKGFRDFFKLFDHCRLLENRHWRLPLGFGALEDDN